MPMPYCAFQATTTRNIIMKHKASKNKNPSPKCKPHKKKKKRRAHTCTIFISPAWYFLLTTICVKLCARPSAAEGLRQMKGRECKMAKAQKRSLVRSLQVPFSPRSWQSCSQCISAGPN